MLSPRSIGEIAAPLIKRHLDDGGEAPVPFPEFPKWLWALFGIDFLIFLPMALFVRLISSNVLVFSTSFDVKS
jgi:hypothetical protein